MQFDSIMEKDPYDNCWLFGDHVVLDLTTANLTRQELELIEYLIDLHNRKVILKNHNVDV